MNKKLIIASLMVLLAASPVLAQSAAQPTGNTYLSMSKQSRVQAVTSLIDDAKRGGVTIKQTPVSYCKRLDKVYVKHPDMKTQPLATVLKTLIIMEYDWSQPGVDKDKLAQQWLGDKLYQSNKARLSKR